VERHKELDIEITFLTLKDIDAQLAALSDNSFMKVMVAVYIFAGLRREEAMWLTVHDIDLKTGNYGVIKVRAKTINGESWEPKTGKNRMVPISSRLRGYLDRYTPAASEGNWFFPSSARTRLDPDNFSEDLREINRKKGLSWSCGDYRHTFGSQLAMANESLFKISTLMGNSPDVCRKHYAALMPESLFQSVEFPESPTGKPEPKPLPEPEPEKVIFNETRKPVLRLVVNNR
jgi:integrase